MARVDPLARLIQVLGRFPGVGEKTATRLAFFILRQGSEFARDLAQAVVEATEKVGYCRRCQNLTDIEVCMICADTRRDPNLLCVVEQVQDLRAIERSREYRGTYHVLHGAIAPLDGVGPDDIKVKELLARLSQENQEVQEVILATNPSVEGEATALYIQRLLSPMGFKVSRIASGLPMGSDIEYVDAATIAQALVGRRLL
ncbi:MAG: recombination mediator RecR [Myxococcales bacterium]|nr:recombination mediator RecR [Myxococcales bacterium]